MTKTTIIHPALALKGISRTMREEAHDANTRGDCISPRALEHYAAMVDKTRGAVEQSARDSDSLRSALKNLLDALDANGSCQYETLREDARDALAKQREQQATQAGGDQ